MIVPSVPKVPWNKGQKLPPEVLTPDEVKALMDACSKRAPTGLRNRAVIVVLYRGLSPTHDATSLKPKALYRAASSIPVLPGYCN